MDLISMGQSRSFLGDRMMMIRRKLFAKIAVAIGLAGLGLLLTVLASNDPEGTSRVFAPWSRSVSVYLSRLFAFLPISMAEVLVYALGLFILVALTLSVVNIFRQRSLWPLLNWIASVALVAAGLFFIFFSLWGLNYYATPLREKEEITESPVEMLYDTSVWLRDEMNRLAPLAPRDQNDVCDAGGYAALAPRAALGYDALVEQGGDFVANLSPPKRVIFPSLFVRFGISGIYAPFTGESIVDTDSIDAHLPFTLCHELAHRQGVAPEDEANYYAFLACTAHPDPTYRYSGYYLAFIYCSNALGREDGDLGAQLWSEVSPLVHADIAAQRAHRAKYEGPLRTVGESTNNAYLQAVGQKGVKSYGLVVDLLIAAYQRGAGVPGE